MACSKYEYVKSFEYNQVLLPQTFTVIRIDGKGFTKFTTNHGFKKPNDIKGLSLMNKCAEEVLKQFSDIWIAYGQSDEFSFVLRKESNLFKRRVEKICSCVTSCFSSAYSYYFKEVFGENLKDIPMFDGRCISYPNKEILRDYLSWRQVDCHINNLYNTCFHLLINEGKMNNYQAQELLKTTKSDQKQEILFNKFGINYNNIDEIFKKGSVLIKSHEIKDKHLNKIEEIKNINLKETESENDKIGYSKKLSYKQVIKVIHEDIIRDDFWKKYTEETKFINS